MPLTVLRRLDAILAPTNDAVMAKHADPERQVLQNQANVPEQFAGNPRQLRPNQREFATIFTNWAAGETFRQIRWQTGDDA